VYVFGKSRDKAVVLEEFRKYAMEGSNLLIDISHNLVNGSFTVVLSACLNHWRRQKNDVDNSRNPGDACQVAAILLLQEY
jgi:hypothetical protein